ncbi:MAG TPA: hypothetical protein VM094_06060 [Gemmatimonadales bacterium]|nr:hypothetical protein [Gemmatimonadales bacterium]
MLSATEIRGAQGRRRSPYSDKQHYQEYILQRIEGFKNSIGRDELMRLGDEAASELQATSEGQFVLTEVLMLETVDRLIVKRLALRPYRRWRDQFRKLREAQRTPVHWGLDGGCALARLLPRIEAHDTALVIGAGAESATYLLAAHDAAVTFVTCDVGCVERVESRMAAEALASLFEGFVAPLGPALPGFLEALDGVDIVVLDPNTLAGFKPHARAALLGDLQRRSRPGGVHVVLGGSRALSPDSIRALYDGWTVEEEPVRRKRPAAARRPDGLLLAKPTCPPDAAAPPLAASI